MEFRPSKKTRTASPSGSPARPQGVEGPPQSELPSRPGTPPPSGKPTRAQARLSVVPTPKQRPAFARAGASRRERAFTTNTTLGSRRPQGPSPQQDTYKLLGSGKESSSSNDASPRESSEESRGVHVSLVTLEKFTLVTSEKDKNLAHGDSLRESSSSASEEGSSSIHDEGHSLSALTDTSPETGASAPWQRIAPDRSKKIGDLVPKRVRFKDETRLLRSEKPPSEATTAKRDRFARQATGLPSSSSTRRSAPRSNAPVARSPIGRAESQPRPPRSEMTASAEPRAQDPLRRDTLDQALDEFKSFVAELDDAEQPQERVGVRLEQRSMSGLIQAMEDLESLSGPVEKKEKKEV